MTLTNLVPQRKKGKLHKNTEKYRYKAYMMQESLQRKIAELKLKESMVLKGKISMNACMN